MFQELMLRLSGTLNFEHDALEILATGVDFPIAEHARISGPRVITSVRLGLMEALDGKLSKEGGLYLKGSSGFRVGVEG